MTALVYNNQQEVKKHSSKGQTSCQTPLQFCTVENVSSHFLIKYSIYWFPPIPSTSIHSLSKQIIKLGDQKDLGKNLAPKKGFQ